VIVLDRDGVINVDKGYHADWTKWEWCSGAPESLFALQMAGYQTAIVTNQSGINRGFFGDDDYFELMAQARSDLFQRLGNKYCYWPTVTVYCPHIPDEQCECRKPKTKLWFDHVEPAFRPIDLARSWFVDDKVENLAFGKELGLNTVLIGAQGVDRCGYWVCGSLHHFAERLLRRSVR